MNRDASMCYGDRSGALRAPELAEPQVLLMGLTWLQAATPELGPNMASKYVQKGSPNSSKIVAKSILEPLRELLATWRALEGHLVASWSALGSLSDSYGALLEESREAPGAILQPLGPSWGPFRGPKSGPRGDSSRKGRNHKTFRTSHKIP